MLRIAYRTYNFSLWCSAIGLLLIYCLYAYHSVLPPYFINRDSCLIYALFISIGFIFFYRRNNLFCPETLFLIVFVFSSYFNEIVLNNLDSLRDVSGVLKTLFSNHIERKGLIIQTASLTLFILGASIVKSKMNKVIGHMKIQFTIKYNFKTAIHILVASIGLYLMALFAFGGISSWFHYNNSNSNYSNTTIVYLTILFLVTTAFVFSYLYQLKVNSLKSLIKNINKIYLLELLSVSCLLMISGNRNEALLIILPAVVSYVIFIQRLSNKHFLICATFGAVILILVGITRQEGVSVNSVQNSEVSLLEIGRDYGSVDINSKYLIEFTDKKSPILFNNALINMFSSVPFLGSAYVYITGIKPDVRSGELTTLGMQNPNNMDSGLGTSLIGDLYYTGNAFFTFLFMFLFGYILSKLYYRFFVEKKFNIWLLILYLFLFSNSLYYIRAEWTMPFRYIGFSFVLTLFLLQFSKNLKINHT